MMIAQEPLTEYEDLKRVFNQLIYPVQFSAEINLKLERITHLLDLIGNPQDSYPVIHVGGTSGKGSTSIMISQILTLAGFKTGLHISPYIQVLNEGFQINNGLTPTRVLIDLLNEIKPAIDEVSRKNPFGKPSYFEVKIALALYLFGKMEVDIAVVEVGLGGRLDATNAIETRIAVITNIGLDHTDILGDTIELIAQDKVGIIKPGQIVISGATQPSTRKIIEDRCELVGAELWQQNRDFRIHNSKDEKWFIVNLPGRTYSDIMLDLTGEFQIQNAGIAIAAVHAFNKTIDTNTIQLALSRTKIPGRMEIVQENPTVILDGAHNPDKIRAASKAINSKYPDKKRYVIFALKQDKAYSEILPFVIDGTDVIIFTTFSTDLWSSMDPKLLKEITSEINKSITMITESDNHKALEIALGMAEQDDLVWITGSLYLVGNLRSHWYPPETLLTKGLANVC